MTRIYVPSAGPESWQQFLADPEKQWRTGYSAKLLAYSWEQPMTRPTVRLELVVQKDCPWLDAFRENL